MEINPSKKNNVSLISMIIILLLISMINASDIVTFNRMDIDARAIGMGGAQTAAVTGVTSTYFNPAGLVFLKGVEFNSMISSGMAYDRSLNFLGVATKLNNFGQRAIAVSVLNSKMSDCPGYDNEDNSLPDYNIKENNVMLSYAELFERYNFYWGATLKMYNSSMNNEEDVGFGFDIGAIYDFKDRISFRYMDNFKFGITFKDLFSKIKNDHVNPQLRLGFAGDLKKGFFTACDISFNLEDDSDFKYALGLEYKFVLSEKIRGNIPKVEKAELFPRLGVNSGDLHFGFGLNFGVIIVDYAYVPKPNSDFNNTHRFSFIFKLN